MLSRLLSLIVLVASLGFSAVGDALGKDKSAFLGVVPGEVTSEIADEYGVRPGEGVLVEGVSSESPAEKIGLRINDIIVSFNSATITGPEEFRNKLRKLEPGDKADIVYVRGGKQKTATVELASREDREFGFFGDDFMKNVPHPPKAPRAPRPEGRHDWNFKWNEEREKVAFAGIFTQSLSEGLAAYFSVKEGALISEVVEDSPADKAGLKAGDVIIKIGDDEIEDEGDVRDAIHDYDPGDKVDFVVVRGGKQETISVTLGEQENTDLGDLHINLEGLESLRALEGLKDAPELAPTEEQLEDLERKLEELQIHIDDLEPMDIRIEQLPDAPRIHIEKYKLGPVRNDERGWQRQWQRLANRVKAEFHELTEDFARLRDELLDLGHELMGRTA